MTPFVLTQNFALQKVCAAVSLSLIVLAASLNSYAGEDHDHDNENESESEHSDSTTINTQYIEASGIRSEIAKPQTLIKSDTLFGVISPVQDQVFRLHASFPSMVEKILVQVGERVKKGQIVARLTNIKTLQSYTLKAPSAGEITARSVNTGDRVDAETILIISDLSKVWVNLSAFPENIEQLKIGQTAKIYDLHGHDHSMGTINYIASKMSGGHIARARAIIDNDEGHWRPGMHVKADIEIGQKPVALAVKINALQTFENNTVIFERQDNLFSARKISTGDQDGQWVEVISGIAAGTEYVSENSFLIKADLLKSGAGHDH